MQFVVKCEFPFRLFTHSNALKRELIEEAGFALKDITFFDKRGFIDIRASIYIAKFDGKIATKVEKNDVIWVDAKDYKDKLYFEHQRYVLNKYIKRKNKGKF